MRVAKHPSFSFFHLVDSLDIVPERASSNPCLSPSPRPSDYGSRIVLHRLVGLADGSTILGRDIRSDMNALTTTGMNITFPIQVLKHHSWFALEAFKEEACSDGAVSLPGGATTHVASRQANLAQEAVRLIQADHGTVPCARLQVRHAVHQVRSLLDLRPLAKTPSERFWWRKVLHTNSAHFRLLLIPLFTFSGGGICSGRSWTMPAISSSAAAIMAQTAAVSRLLPCCASPAYNAIAEIGVGPALQSWMLAPLLSPAMAASMTVSTRNGPWQEVTSSWRKRS